MRLQYVWRLKKQSRKGRHKTEKGLTEIPRARGEAHGSDSPCVDREHRRSRGPQYVDYRFIGIHVSMNQSCIEDRDDAILRSDGADVYPYIGVSLASSRQYVIVKQVKKQKEILLPKHLL